MKGRVILFIVEGASDEDTLMPWIENKLKDLRIRAKIKIMSGDKLTRYIENTQTYEITSDNVKGKISDMLKEFMNSSDIKADYIKWNDIFKIYYITDTDNCFKNNTPSLSNKRECLKRMFKFDKIGIKNFNPKKIEVILFGNNLKHVIYGTEEELSKDMKERLSKEFGDKTLTGEWDFREKFENEEIKNWYSYKKNYAEVIYCEGRLTNITALIEEIENRFEEETERI